MRAPVAAALAALAIATVACRGVATNIGGRPGPEAGLLRGKMPLRSAHVSHLDRLTDGIGAYPDDPARTELTSLFRSTEAFVVFDLGAETAVECVALDAEGREAFAVALSSDGNAFAPLWTAPAVEDAGVQPRAGRNLHGRGRYLRVAGAGGDGVYAVAEVSAAGPCPAQWPPVLALQHGAPVDQSAATKAWAFAALAAAYVLAYRRKLPDFCKLLVAAPIGLLIALVLQLAEIWPPQRSLLLPLLAAPVIVGAAFAIRTAIARRARGTRSDRT